MRILVTNDDGIESEGLHALVAALATTEHDIIVVAPDTNWSGASAGIGPLSFTEPLNAERVEVPGAEQVVAWAVGGSPAVTVLAGMLGGFGPQPDLVVSGINAGPNTGRAILHSGTVGAAFTGQNFGISGLAVSSGYDEDGFVWETAAELAVSILDLLIDSPRGTVLNLNVPSVSSDDLKGIRWGRIATFGAFRASMTSSDAGGLHFELEPTEAEVPEDSDQGLIDAGYASLTSLVGVMEAWPDIDAVPRDSLHLHPVPGADLAPVHRFGSVPLAFLADRPDPSGDSTDGAASDDDGRIR